MVLLVLFALIAGAATAITPCVLPVLPALLSASATGGRRRPLGIILGLTVTHTITIVALAESSAGSTGSTHGVIAVAAPASRANSRRTIIGRSRAQCSRISRLRMHDGCAGACRRDEWLGCPR